MATGPLGDGQPTRIQDLASILGTASVMSCLAGLRPIPSTLIDTGELKNVPYHSFANLEAEVNVYGDPDRPAAVEAGTRSPQPMLRDCLRLFVRAVLVEEADRAVVEQMGTAPTFREKVGLTVEVTPPESADAYGAWWVTAEVHPQLEHSRASPEEIQAISTGANSVAQGPPSSSPAAAPLPPTPSSWPTSYRPSGGPVFVHGYYRRNGTYVHPHSRRR